jgi:phage-related protein (TIGR01555 family)
LSKVSIKNTVRDAKREDKAARLARTASKTTDSMVNFAANFGIGADNLMSTTTYGFNPITRNRILLEWIHRGSWLGGVAVDVVADDMTRAGVDIRGELKPDKIEQIEQAVSRLGVWSAVSDTVKWSRLYGGAIAVMLIEGQDMATPLRLETVAKDQFKGLLALDRWMVDPSLNDLVTDLGPDLGNPKFYTVLATAPAVIKKRIHYSRCLRLEGIRLSYWQRVMENLWGISVLERLYDRMVAFDSATTGAAQLVYKAYLRCYKIKGLREVISAGGPAMQNLLRFTEFMRSLQSIEGITLIDADDDLAAITQPSFAGLSDALMQFGQQLGGALQIPLTRLFGQSPTGMNATGESDLRTYYDGIKQRQNRELLVPMTNVYRAVAQSEGIKLTDSFSLDFRSLWVLSDDQKASIGSTDSTAVTGVFNAGVISPKVALKELRQLSKTSGRFTNITDKDINAASDETGAGMVEEQHGMGMETGAASLQQMEDEPAGGAPNGKAKKKQAAA